MRILSALAILVVAGLLGAVAFAYSGLYDVSASSAHSGPVAWLLGTTSHASIERRARDVTVPDLSDEALVLAGVNDYSAMCAGCHGAPGIEPEAFGQGLNPAAPDLARSAEHMTAAELFWVTKHGIKMTGMPSWGATHDDASLWPVVALMTRLPAMDERDYQSLLARADGMGHHNDDGDMTHSHGDDGDTHGSAHDAPMATNDTEASQGHVEHTDHPEKPVGDESDQSNEHDHSNHDH